MKTYINTNPIKTITILVALFISAGISAQTSYGTGAGTGGNGTYFGENAGAVTLGNYNTFIGTESGSSNINGVSNTFLGQNTGKTNLEGSRNVFIGAEAGFSNADGHNNTFIGYQSGKVSQGSGNSFVGYLSGLRNTSGNNNTFIGLNSGLNNTTGANNTYFGTNAGSNNTTGSGNVFLGYSAGYYETGSNKLYIANSNTATPLIYGEFDNNKIVFNGNVGIDCQAPDAKLTVNGDIKATKVDITETVPCSDYVFESDYNLRTLEEVEEFVTTNKHLPEVPSAAEFKENGYNVGEMDDVLLRKVEELTLYIIAQQKQIDELKKLVD